VKSQICFWIALKNTPGRSAIAFFTLSSLSPYVGSLSRSIAAA